MALYPTGPILALKRANHRMYGLYPTNRRTVWLDLSNVDIKDEEIHSMSMTVSSLNIRNKDKDMIPEFISDYC
jgi:hypothetical protein